MLRRVQAEFAPANLIAWHASMSPRAASALSQRPVVGMRTRHYRISGGTRLSPMADDRRRQKRPDCRSLSSPFEPEQNLLELIATSVPAVFLRNRNAFWCGSSSLASQRIFNRIFPARSTPGNANDV